MSSVIEWLAQKDKKVGNLSSEDSEQSKKFLRGKRSKIPQSFQSIRIAWLQQPIIMFNSDTLFAWMQRILGHYFFCEQLRAFESRIKCQGGNEYLEQFLACQLRKNILRSYHNTCYCSKKILDLPKIKEFAKERGETDELIQKGFAMSLAEAKSLSKLDLNHYEKYTAQLEQSYYKSLQLQAFEILEIEEKADIAKKIKRMKKRCAKKLKAKKESQQPQLSTAQQVNKTEMYQFQQFHSERVSRKLFSQGFQTSIGKISNKGDEEVKCKKSGEIYKNEQHQKLLNKVEISNNLSQKMFDNEDFPFPGQIKGEMRKKSQTFKGLNESTEVSTQPNSPIINRENIFAAQMTKCKTEHKEFIEQGCQQFSKRDKSSSLCSLKTNYYQDNRPNRRHIYVAKAQFIEKQTRRIYLETLNVALNARLAELAHRNGVATFYKNKAYFTVKEIMEYNYPQCSLTIFGSSITGLQLPSSDIDILLCPTQQRFQPDILGILEYIFSNTYCISYCKAIPTANNPVIKIIVDTSVDPYFNPISQYRGRPCSEQNAPFLVKVDIALNYQGVKNCGTDATIMMKRTFDMQPRLRDIIIILKSILQSLHLTQLYKGGVSSYTLYVMLISFVEANQINPWTKTTAELLIMFLQFYTKEFRPNEQVIIFQPNCRCFLTIPEYLSIPLVEHPNKNRLLNIVDPTTGRLMRACFSKIESVIRAFGNSLGVYSKLEQMAKNSLEQTLSMSHIEVSQEIKEKVASVEQRLGKWIAEQFSNQIFPLL